MQHAFAGAARILRRPKWTEVDTAVESANPDFDLVDAEN